MALSFDDLKRKKAEEDQIRQREQEEKNAEAEKHESIKSFFEKELEKEIKKTGFYKRLLYVYPLIFFVVLVVLFAYFFIHKDEITMRQADAEAYSIDTVAKATARAIESNGKALKENPDIVGLYSIQKWDGKLPVTMVPNTPLPFVNVK